MSAAHGCRTKSVHSTIYFEDDATFPQASN
jgi:hypothetical protein